MRGLQARMKSFITRKQENGEKDEMSERKQKEEELTREDSESGLADTTAALPGASSERDAKLIGESIFF